jgi:hypothetical protein
MADSYRGAMQEPAVAGDFNLEITLLHKSSI